MALTISSPGVQINEVDLSQSASLQQGTYVTILGFAGTGPTNEPIQINSLSEFKQTFGLPTNAAERYAYHTVAPVLASSAIVNFIRLPYGENAGEGYGNSYGALVYPAHGKYTMWNASTSSYSSSTTPDFSKVSSAVSGVFAFGKPVHVELTQEQYDAIQQNDGFDWNASGADVWGSLSALSAAFKNAGMVVLNQSQTTVTSKFEGYYLGIVDNTNLNPNYNHDEIVNVGSLVSNNSSTDDYTSLPSSRLNFALTGESNRNTKSISEVLENIPEYDLNNRSSDDQVVFGLFKIRQSVYATDAIKLDYVLAEKYYGSMDFNRQIQNTNGGAAISDFISNKSKNSVNIDVKVNPYISGKIDKTTWLDTNGVPTKKVRFLNNSLHIQEGETAAQFEARTGLTTAEIASLELLLGKADAVYPIGVYAAANVGKEIGSIPSKLSNVFDLIEDDEYFTIDILPEGGLGNIHAYQQAIKATIESVSGGTSVYGYVSADIPFLQEKLQSYDDTFTIPGLDNLKASGEYEADTADLRGNYNVVASSFIDFCENRRKDCITVLDGIRQTQILGENTKVYVPGKRGTFTKDIYNPLRHLFGLVNTSYATHYSTWLRMYDEGSDDNVWVPFSGVAAFVYARTDANFQPWYGPFGYTRGLLSGVSGLVDIAFSPKQKERDTLYKVNINPVFESGTDGFVIMGDRTAISKTSLFQYIGVRRMFLYTERSTKNAAKYFVSEPNNMSTRIRLINTLTPIFEYVKQTQGLYDYMLVSDERNNTSSDLANGILNLDIYLKPIGSTQFINVTFYATQEGTNFDELI